MSEDLDNQEEGAESSDNQANPSLKGRAFGLISGLKNKIPFLKKKEGAKNFDLSSEGSLLENIEAEEANEAKAKFRKKIIGFGVLLAILLILILSLFSCVFSGDSEDGGLLAFLKKDKKFAYFDREIPYVLMPMPRDKEEDAFLEQKPEEILEDFPEVFKALKTIEHNQSLLDKKNEKRDVKDEDAEISMLDKVIKEAKLIKEDILEEKKAQNKGDIKSQDEANKNIIEENSGKVSKAEIMSFNAPKLDESPVEEKKTVTTENEQEENISQKVDAPKEDALSISKKEAQKSKEPEMQDPPQDFSKNEAKNVLEKTVKNEAKNTIEHTEKNVVETTDKSKENTVTDSCEEQKKKSKEDIKIIESSLPDYKQPLSPLRNHEENVLLKTPSVKSITIPDDPIAPILPIIEAQSEYLEKKGNKYYPKPSDKGISPWQAYAGPFTTKSGYYPVAVIISGLGLDDLVTDVAIKGFPPEVTLAFSPYDRKLSEHIKQSRFFGHEVLIELPMEPYNYPLSDMGPKSLLTILTPPDNISRLEKLLATDGAYSGFLGSADTVFGSSPIHMRPILERIKKSGLIYVDNTNGKGILPNRDTKVPMKIVDLNIDRNDFALTVDAKLEHFEKLAEYRGQALAIVPPNQVTLLKLMDWIKTFYNVIPAEKEIPQPYVLAPISAIVTE
ncbi:MAG: divergent polysaccharide deacetylase family protein [Alphaproteobacteria bacterium]